MEKLKISTVEEYIAQQSPELRAPLRQLRETIRKAAPEAEEILSYQMPAYKFHGMLLWFAAHKSHFGLYPMASTIVKFKSKLGAYEIRKGTIQFPFGKTLPLKLITEITKFRVKENIEKIRLKEMTRKKKSGK
jgi:uncharacterized protein YdhG (YjbR/CyaY superfamily)